MTRIDAQRWRTLDPYLDEALDLPEAQRDAWLETLAREDAALAGELRALLALHTAAEREGYLEDGVAICAPLAEPASLAGLRIGPYTLEAPLGRGGMGSVWRARRDDGRYEGSVAVKFLDPRLVGGIGEERFRREGRILAQLTHPHIARLIDAGVSAAGQPYLMLEHVEGQRIDEYCDAQGLDVARRLRLFLDVLAAVAHAHAHLIVHRDLKPSNVLVTNEGDVKLLDFGIAKLLEVDALADGAELTREGGRALTPEYAAPEQVLGEPVTTATDVYALGVLLYVLLTGRHPAGDTTGSPARMIHAIVDSDAPRPSAIVTSTKTLPADALATNAALRAATPQRLRRILQGDLDNIWAKAQKKNPQERYASVADLAEDVRRHLNHEPVAARADSFAYRAASFVRRHRLPVALAGVALLALLAGLAGTITQARRATAHAAQAESERNRANAQLDVALRQLSRAEAINDLNDFLISDAAPGGAPMSVEQLLERAAEVIEQRHGESDANRVAMLIAVGRGFRKRDRDDEARRLLGEAYELSRGLDDPTLRARASCALGPSVADGGDLARAEQLIQDGLAELPDEPLSLIDRINCLWRGAQVARGAEQQQLSLERVQAAYALLPELRYPSPDLELHIAIELAQAYSTAGRDGEAIAAFQHAYDRLAALGREHTETAGTLLNNWALALEYAGQPLQAEPLYRRAIRISSFDGTERNVSPWLLNNLARTLGALGRLPEAADYAERAYAMAKDMGADTIVYQTLLVRAGIYRQSGQLERAAAMLAEAGPIMEAVFGPGHPALSPLVSQQAMLDQARGALDAALAGAQAVVAQIQAAHIADSILALYVSRLADVEFDARRFDDAERDARRAIALLGDAGAPGVQSSDVGNATLTLGRALVGEGRVEEAQPILASALAQLRQTLGDEHPRTRLAAALLTSNAEGVSP